MNREELIKNLIADMGWNLSDPNFADTPRSFISYLEEFNQHFEPPELKTFPVSIPNTEQGIVGQWNIPFRMVCAHHLLPAFGYASLGYIPHNEVVGLSKIVRLVDWAGLQKPSLQEHITENIMNVFGEALKPKGIIVYIKAEHSCVTARGAAAPGVQTVTSSVSGLFRTEASARKEFFDLCR